MAAQWRRRASQWFAAGTLAAIASVFLVLWLRPDGSKITMENYEKLEAGMTIPRIRSILGPEGDYSGSVGRSWTDVVRNRLAAPQGGESPTYVWYGERVSIGIWTNESGTVEHISCWSHESQKASFLERISHWFGIEH